MSPRLDGAREASLSRWLALTPFILQKSRMRRRARTDLCGGRSAMGVPTAPLSRRFSPSLALFSYCRPHANNTWSQRVILSDVNKEKPDDSTIKVRSDGTAISARRGETGGQGPRCGGLHES